jgi:hypothetical protein
LELVSLRFDFSVLLSRLLMLAKQIVELSLQLSLGLLQMSCPGLELKHLHLSGIEGAVTLRKEGMETCLEGFEVRDLSLVLTSDVLDLSPEFVILPLGGIAVTLELIHLLLHLYQSLCKGVSFLLM